ncbi:hypothetical protein Pelo_7552 [Pelomyxa schiedti]|nr:hypothetical protein Pelo_7552 [Pelomyxa schiedti]
MGSRQSAPRVPAVTTAESQAMAMCCAAVVRLAGSFCCQSLVQWARCPSLVRYWARSWVLRSERVAVFCLPVVGKTEDTRGENYFLGRLQNKFSVVDWSSGSTVNSRGPTLFCLRRHVEQPTIFVCNRRWFVAWTATDGLLHVTKFVGDGGGGGVRTTVQQPGPLCFAGFEERVSRLQLLLWPRSHDLVVVINAPLSIGGPSFVTLVDLDESFRKQDLVITKKFDCGGTKTAGVMWMPDGSLGILRDAILNIELVDVTTQKVYEYPHLLKITPIGDCQHAFARPMHDSPQFAVYHTGNFSSPTLCVPCTRALPCKESGLIVSTIHNKFEKGMCWTLHDGITGFRVGDIAVKWDPRFTMDTETDYWNLFFSYRIF